MGVNVDEDQSNKIQYCIFCFAVVFCIVNIKGRSWNQYLLLFRMCSKILKEIFISKIQGVCSTRSTSINVTYFKQIIYNTCSVILSV